MHELFDLGFGPYFEEQVLRLGIAEAVPARISAEHRGGYHVWAACGEGLAQPSGRLRIQLEDALPAVGDWVVLRNAPSEKVTTVIDHVLDRRSAFTRGAAGREMRTQVVAANVDLVFAVCGLDADFNVHGLERYVARIWASGATPMVILNKADLCDVPEARILEVSRSCPGVPVFTTSALFAIGVEEIRTNLRSGVTAALVGSSGAGKSTLINALAGEQRMPTGSVRARDGRGCHVTTHRQLVRLPHGGILLDTPGMRELQLMDGDGLDSVFDEILALSTQCRYRDCRHNAEPGCAVREAIESGVLSDDRRAHYQKLVREAEANERRHDQRLRKKAERTWGQLHDEVKHLRRLKGGKN